MTLKLYNTFTREKEEFEPIEKNKVRIYSCGQTIYDDLHIGNARSYSYWDILRRYLDWKGYEVFHVQNITDVGHLTDDRDQGEDKVEKRAKEKGMEPMVLVEKQLRRYYDDMDALNIKRHHINPRATQHIHEMIEAVKKIIGNGYAYERSGSVYFDVMKFHKDHGYAKMSGMDIGELETNASGRVGKEVEEKKNPLDFALWIKADPEHLMKWRSPWSDGYPGWHLECSVMSTKYLGKKFDIHTGGVDHIFPHHPNERAQNYGIYNLNEEPVNYWLHAEFINVKGEKMSKSKGNFYTVKELLKEFDGEVIRYFLASSHYRKQVNFNKEKLEDAREELEKFYNTLNMIESSEGGKKQDLRDKIKETRKGFKEAMDDDLDTPRALTVLHEFRKEVNKSLDNEKEILEDSKELIIELGSIFGLKLSESGKREKDVEEIINLLLEVRKKLREKEEYELSDGIRTNLDKLGIEVQDTEEGMEWNFK